MTENLDSCRVKSIMNNILKNDFPILETKNRKGHTDYIDYIQKKEVSLKVHQLLETALKKRRNNIIDRGIMIEIINFKL